MIDSIKLRNNFSKVAKNYERHAQLQARIADGLLGQLNGATYEYILDIGMGTGRLTQKLAFKYPGAKVFGCDFAEGMVWHARKKNGFYPFCAEAVFLPFKRESFDFAISNLSYQWIYNLETAFLGVSRVLRKRGEFIFSCFTNGTLRELLESYSHISGNMRMNHQIDNKLPSKDKILDNLLSAGFKINRINSYSIIEYYKDAFEIVNWLKKIGANHNERSTFLGKQAWQSMNDYYCRNFLDNGRVFATFEVIEVSAQK